MGRLAAALVVASALPFQLSAQERSRLLERIDLALQPPPPVSSGADPQESLRVSTLRTLGGATVEPLPVRTKLGPFTLETPRLQGEFIRLSLPIGEYVMRGARGLAAANRRRQESAARRRVEADLRAFAGGQPPKQ